MADRVELDVLAIGAHPDDVEITSGGLLIKIADMDRRTGILDLTCGEMGTHGDEHDRAREAAAAAEVLGLAYRGNLELPDAAVEVTQQNKLKLAQVIRDTEPELVVLPHWVQRHPDHAACSRLGYDACFLAGLRKIELQGEPHRPRKIIYASYFRNMDYSFLVDISDVFERKLEVVASYRSQFGDMARDRDDIFHPGVGIHDLMHTRARHLGQLVNVQYAEAYTIREHLLINDPQKMLMRSI